MSIQYAGGVIANTIFTATTRQAVVTALNNALKTAGWSVIIGDGTDDVVLQTASTPLGNFCQVELKDPGSGNCAQIWLRTSGGTPGRTHWIYPNNRVFRIIANKYQFFIFPSGVSGTSVPTRSFVALGTPYIPAFMGCTNGEYGWSHSTGSADDNSDNKGCWRTYIHSTTSNDNTQFSILWAGAMATNVDYSGAGGACGGPGLIPGPYWPATTGTIWADGSIPIMEAFLTWAGGNSAQLTIRGMLWDALVAWSPMAADSTLYFDNNLFYAITNQNLMGTLCVKVA